MAITRRLALRHEGLVLRLEALCRHAGAIAARKPELAVDAQTRALAEALLYDCRPFLRGLGALPPVAPGFGALAAQLNGARAGLEAFELRHAGWDPKLKCQCWRTADAGAMPVGRLHPEAAAAAPKPEESAIKLALMRRIKASQESHYDMGYAAGIKAAAAGDAEADDDGLGATDGDEDAAFRQARPRVR